MSEVQTESVGRAEASQGVELPANGHVTTTVEAKTNGETGDHSDSGGNDGHGEGVNGTTTPPANDQSGTTTATAAVTATEAAHFRSPEPRGVHLVGSFPLDSLPSPTAVFERALAALPGRLRRVPDGELGERASYIRFQEAVFPEAVRRLPHLASGTTPDRASFALTAASLRPTTGYDAAALASYASFAALKRGGAVPAATRFQLSLPSPAEVVAMWVHPAWQGDAAPLYEALLAGALARVQARVPAGELAVQFDAAVTFALVEAARGRMARPLTALDAAAFPDPEAYCLEALARAAAAVAPGVELGFHLCYGDMQHRHFVEPVDAGEMVRFVGRLVRRLGPARPVAWVHMPVPKGRVDAEYFRPLEGLDLPDETELFLGLVHHDDLEGTRKRIDVARRVVPRRFGVATECGMGRTPVEHLDGILAIAKEVTVPY